MARPTSYTDEIAMEICTRLAEGESLRTICEDERMPSRRTVLYWLLDKDHEEFLRQYTFAREAQADHYAEEIVEISDEVEVETIYRGESVVLDVSVTAVNRNRLRVDARKWYASKLAPKKYSEKHALEHTGKDGQPLPAPVTNVQAGVLVVPGVIQDQHAWSQLVQGAPKGE
jgi:hypothetical protein